MRMHPVVIKGNRGTAVSVEVPGPDEEAGIPVEVWVRVRDGRLFAEMPPEQARELGLTLLKAAHVAKYPNTNPTKIPDCFVLWDDPQSHIRVLHVTPGECESCEVRENCTLR